MARIRLPFHDFTSLDTKMRVMLGAIVWWERWLFHGLHFVVSVSGLVYLFMKWGMTTDDPFALVNHPWQPGMLTTHVIAAPLFIAACGMLFRSHVLKKIMVPSLHNRRSGWVSVISFAVMALSGYWIQVASTPGGVSAAVWTHVVSSLVFIIGYGVHLVIGWNPGKQDLLVPRPASPPVSNAAATNAGRRVGAAVLLAVSFLFGGAPAGASSPDPVRVERTVFLMGTAARFVAEAADRGAGLARLERMIRVVEETEAELSTWREGSALSRLNRQPIGEPLPVAPRLCATMRRVAAWRQATGGAFDPAVGRRPETRPGRDGHGAPEAAGFDLLAVAAEPCSLTRRGDLALDAGAFGKGEALDRVREAERGRPGAWLVDLGGQVAVSEGPGRNAWTVALAHPRRRREGVASLELRGGSLSTSGGSERDRTTADSEPAGHIQDPRTGLPVRRPESVVVWKEEALAADALSTALYVLGPEEGLPWAEERGLAAAFLAPRPDSGEVEIRTTAAFRARFTLRPGS